MRAGPPNASMKVTHRRAAIAFVFAAVMFALYPQVDLWFTGLFYDPAHGFAWRESATLRALYKIVPYIGWVSFAVLCVVIALGFIRPDGRLRTYRKVAVYLLLVLFLGPGLVVNELIKAHSGRARPSYSQPFGGDKAFTRAFVPADQCERNCSFVSGHAAVGFYFLSFAFVFTAARRTWLVVGVALGSFFGLARIVEGAHFLSDVVFSGFTIYFVAALVDWLMFGRANARAEAASADDA